MTQLFFIGNSHIFGNETAADLLARAGTSTEPLTPAAQIRGQASCSYIFRHFHNVHYQHSVGTLDEVRYRSLLGPMFRNLRSRRFREARRIFRQGFDGPFRELVDKVVARYDQEGATLEGFAVVPPDPP